jgi:hypothetical protein
MLIKKGDGIFDQIKSEETLEAVWKVVKEEAYKNKSVHSICITGVDLIMKTALRRKTFDNITLLFVAFGNFEKTIQEIFEEHEEAKNPVNYLNNNEFYNKSESNCKIANLRFETENFSTKNILRESNIIAKESVNILLSCNNNTNENNQVNTVDNVSTRNEKKYSNFNNREMRSISSNNNKFNLQSLIKNQIEHKSKNKSRSDQKTKVLSYATSNLYEELINYSQENVSHQLSKKSLEIPFIDINKKFSVDSNDKFSENVYKINFNRNLLNNKETPKELITQTPMQLKDQNIPVKLLSLENNLNNIKIPINRDKNGISLGIFNSNHGKN